MRGYRAMTNPMPGGTDRIRFGRVSLATGVSLHYADKGTKGKAPLVFLHGFVDSWRSFIKVIEFLAPGRRAIACDLRGHGDSDKPEGGYFLADFTQDLLLFIDALGLDKANLVGHSMGSFIAQSFAAIHPHRVERLVLIGSAPYAVDNAALLEVKPMIDALHDPLERDFISGFQATGDPVPAEFMDMIISETMKVPARVWRSVFAGLLQVDLRPILHAVAAPTLIMWGNRDMIFTRRDQETLLSQIPDSMLKEFDAGHALHWEKPKEVAAALESFLY
jgi:pimeloyl-ACP methyl ester carboxylesterase